MARGTRKLYQEENQPRQAAQNDNARNTGSRNLPLDPRRTFPHRNDASGRNTGRHPDGVQPVDRLRDTPTNNSTPSVSSQDFQRPRFFAGIPVSGLAVEDQEGGVVNRRQHTPMHAIPDWEHPLVPAVPREWRGPASGHWIHVNGSDVFSELTLKGFTLPTMSETVENDEEEEPYGQPLLSYNRFSSPNASAADPSLQPVLHRGSSPSLNLPTLSKDPDAEWSSEPDTIRTRPTVCTDDFDPVAPPKSRIISNQPQIQEANLTQTSNESTDSGPESVSPTEFVLRAPLYPAVKERDAFDPVTPPRSRIFSNQPQIQEANLTQTSNEGIDSGPESVSPTEFVLRASSHPGVDGLERVNADDEASPQSARMSPRYGSFALGPGNSDATARRPSDSSSDVRKLDRQDASMTEGVEGDQKEYSFPQLDLMPSSNVPIERRRDSDFGLSSARDTSTNRPTDRPQFLTSEARSQEVNLPPDDRESPTEFALRAREEPGMEELEGVNGEPAVLSARFPGIDLTSPQLPRRPRRNGTSARGAPRDLNLSSQMFVSELTLEGFSLPMTGEAWENDQQEHPSRRTGLRYNRSLSWNAPAAVPTLQPVLQRERSSSLNLPTESYPEPDAEWPSEINSVGSRPTVYTDDFDNVAPPSARNNRNQPQIQEATLTPKSKESNNAEPESPIEYPLRAPAYPPVDEHERFNADAAGTSTCLAIVDRISPHDAEKLDRHRRAAMLATADKEIPFFVPLSSAEENGRSGDSIDRLSHKRAFNQPTQLRRDSDVGWPIGSDAVASRPTDRSRILSREHEGKEANLAPNRSESNNAGLEAPVEFPLRAHEYPAAGELENTNASAARPAAFLDMVWPQSTRKMRHSSSFKLGASREFEPDNQRDDEGPSASDVKVSGQPGHAQDVGKLDRQQHNVEDKAPAVTHVRPFPWIETRKESSVSDISVDDSEEWDVPSMDDAALNDLMLQDLHAPSPFKPTDTMQSDVGAPRRNVSIRTRGVPDSDSQDSLRQNIQNARTKTKSAQGEFALNPRDAGGDTGSTLSMSIGDVNAVSQEPTNPGIIQADRTGTNSPQGEIAWNPRDAGYDTGAMLSMSIGDVNAVSQEPANPGIIQADRTETSSPQGDIAWNPRDAGDDTGATLSMSVGDVNGVSQVPTNPVIIPADRTETNSAQNEIAWNARDAGTGTRATLPMSSGEVNRVSQEPASGGNIQIHRASRPLPDSYVGETPSQVSVEPNPASVTMVLDFVPTAGRARTTQLLRQHSPSTVIMILISELDDPPAFSLEC